MTIPPYLRPGDTIALTCPAGYMPRENAQTCIDTLQAWGYNVHVGRTLWGDGQTLGGGGSTSDGHGRTSSNASGNYFSGTDNERLTDLQQLLDDPTIKAVLCGRGGYGLSRIIDQIDLSAFKKSPKWVIGFSDITLLLSHILANSKIATLHAPMAGAFNDGGVATDYIQSLRRALAGEPARYTCAPHPLNHPGTAKGRLVGGNLSLLAHALGTASDVKTKGRILFLEDVGEYLYNIDRMLRQLKRSGKLDHLAGLIAGGFTELKDTQRPFGASVEEIIRDVVREYDYPVCFGFPVGHQKENYALQVGGKYTLKIKSDQVSLESQ